MDELINARQIMELVYGKKRPKMEGRERQRVVATLATIGIREAYSNHDGRGRMRLWRKADVMPFVKSEQERLAERATVTQSAPPPAPADEAKGNGLILKALSLHEASLKTVVDESCAKTTAQNRGLFMMLTRVETKLDAVLRELNIKVET